MFCPFFKENSLCCGVVVYFSGGSSFYTKRLLSSRGLVSLSILLQKTNLLFSNYLDFFIADCSVRPLAPSVCICTTNKEIAPDKNNEDPVDKFDSSFSARY